jgi:hypothetical protein
MFLWVIHVQCTGRMGSGSGPEIADIFNYILSIYVNMWRVIKHDMYHGTSMYVIAVNDSKLMSGHISIKLIKQSERNVILQHPKRQSMAVKLYGYNQ